jgi:hypothetical protein
VVHLPLQERGGGPYLQIVLYVYGAERGCPKLLHYAACKHGESMPVRVAPISINLIHKARLTVLVPRGASNHCGPILGPILIQRGYDESSEVLDGGFGELEMWTRTI